MTKDGFWRIISKCTELCDCCPVQIEGKTEGCMENCAESLKSLYEQLEREDKELAERALEIERADWEREDDD